MTTSTSQCQDISINKQNHFVFLSLLNPSLNKRKSKDQRRIKQLIILFYDIYVCVQSTLKKKDLLNGKHLTINLTQKINDKGRLQNSIMSQLKSYKRIMSHLDIIEVNMSYYSSLTLQFYFIQVLVSKGISEEKINFRHCPSSTNKMFLKWLKRIEMFK